MWFKSCRIVSHHFRCSMNIKSLRRISDARPTIYQLSSGFVRSGVAVLRISGESALQVPKLMTSCNKKPLEPRKMYLRKIRDSLTKEILDSGFVVTFHKPNSFTGEDMVELHVHGGTAVIKAILASLGKIPNFQPAEAGEFTRRAFLNGKLDLTEVEGLADLLQAETEAQRRQALRQMEGDLGRLYTSWRNQLIKCLAQIEAYIDFGEEENVEEALGLVTEGLKRLQIDLEKHLNNAAKGQRLRTGVRATISGKPNVGKSSLLNAICGQDLAIISPIAGTTRDVVESALNVGGYPLLISDTAGIRRHTTDPIELEGVKRALKRVQESDLLIFVIDASSSSLDSFDISSICADADLKSLLGQEPRPEAEKIIVFNKSDILSKSNKSRLEQQISNDADICLTSCQTGEGLSELSILILRKLKSLCGNPLEENASMTQERHQFHVLSSYKQISNSLQFISDENVVFAAEELRRAVRSLGKITGKVTTEEVLDVIFKDFCIGK